MPTRAAGREGPFGFYPYPPLSLVHENWRENSRARPDAAESASAPAPEAVAVAFVVAPAPEALAAFVDPWNAYEVDSLATSFVDPWNAYEVDSLATSSSESWRPCRAWKSAMAMGAIGVKAARPRRRRGMHENSFMVGAARGCGERVVCPTLRRR